MNEGEIVGILGHNGMGKTTLLRTLMGYLPATDGTVHFSDRDITRLSPTARARLGIGYVPQGREIFATLTVAENLRMGCLRLPDSRQTDRCDPDRLSPAHAPARPRGRRAVGRRTAVAGAGSLPLRANPG